MTIRSNNKRRWILASASPRRREIMSGLGLSFAIDPSLIPEPGYRRGEEPGKYAVRAARLKTRDVGNRYDSGIVVGADTVVFVRRHILGKPSNREQARKMLAHLSGRWHNVATGMCLFDCELRRMRSACSVSRVHLHRLEERDIEWYLNTGEYRDKAGAYGIQGLASLFIDRIEGCYFNVVGFPLATFHSLCRLMGINLIEELRATPTSVSRAGA